MPSHYGKGGKGAKKITDITKSEMSLMKRFMKESDPNSVVRPSEFMMSAAGQNFIKALRRRKKDPNSAKRAGEM